MKALPKRKGNFRREGIGHGHVAASMKALPKRKGNLVPCSTLTMTIGRLNESPSEKEGK